LPGTASSDNVGVTNYLIERCQGPGCSSFAQVATSPTTTFSVYGSVYLIPAYSYQVQRRATRCGAEFSAGYIDNFVAYPQNTHQSSRDSPIALSSLPMRTIHKLFHLYAGVLRYPFAEVRRAQPESHECRRRSAGRYERAVRSGRCQSPWPVRGPLDQRRKSKVPTRNILTHAIDYYPRSSDLPGMRMRDGQFNGRCRYADIRIWSTADWSGQPVDVTAAAIGAKYGEHQWAATTTNGTTLFRAQHRWTRVLGGLE